MGLIADQPNLTVINPDLERARRATHPGMAHFAGSGPNETCRMCIFWTGCGVDPGYFARKGMRGGMIKPRACAKYKELMQGNAGPAVPHNAGACKYFEPNQNPPPAFEKASAA